MKEEQKKLLVCLQTDFNTLWDKFCDIFPDIKSIFSNKELTKMGVKYAAKYKALCDSQQEIITSACFFDEFISSLGNGNQAKDFKEMVNGIGDVIKIAQKHAINNRNQSVFTKIKQTIKDMIVTMDESPLSNNSDYRNRLNELLVFNWLSECENIKVISIEKKLENGKSCDFECQHKDGTIVLLEVLSINNLNVNKQDDSKTFSAFINSKVKDKFNDKTNRLSFIPNIKIIPILEYTEGLENFKITVNDKFSLKPFTVVKNKIDESNEIYLGDLEEISQQFLQQKRTNNGDISIFT